MKFYNFLPLIKWESKKGQKKKDENWEFRDKSDKVRESMKWWLKKMEREREREREIERERQTISTAIMSQAVEESKAEVSKAANTT